MIEIRSNEYHIQVDNTGLTVIDPLGEQFLSLTQGQYDVLALKAIGQPNSSVAKMLGLSPQTVSNHCYDARRRNARLLNHGEDKTLQLIVRGEMCNLFDDWMAQELYQGWDLLRA